jgi:hypothetical protein
MLEPQQFYITKYLQFYCHEIFGPIPLKIADTASNIEIEEYCSGLLRYEIPQNGENNTQNRQICLFTKGMEFGRV